MSFLAAISLYVINCHSTEETAIAKNRFHIQWAVRNLPRARSDIGAMESKRPTYILDPVSPLLEAPGCEMPSREYHWDRRENEK